MNLIDFFKKLFRIKKKELPESDWKDGLIPSPVDFRDIPMSAVLRGKKLAPLPAIYRIPYILNIKDQDNTPHCVGYACATIKEFLENREGNSIEFDGDWIYNECKKIDNYDGPGTYFRAGLKILHKIGAKPLNRKEEEASKYRIGGYVRIECDFISLKQAIYEFGAILIGFRGSQEGWKTAFIRLPREGEKQWGHAVTGIGFEVTYINGQNSWSEKWGNEGLFYFTEEYVPIEAWAILVDLPNNWQELIGKDRERPKYFFQNNLWIGLKNNEVKILQDCLKWLGCFNPKIDSTGYFGPITLEATKIYQQRKGLPQTGYFGPLTREAINKDLT